MGQRHKGQEESPKKIMREDKIRGIKRDKQGGNERNRQREKETRR